MICIYKKRVNLHIINMRKRVNWPFISISVNYLINIFHSYLPFIYSKMA